MMDTFKISDVYGECSSNEHQLNIENFERAIEYSPLKEKEFLPLLLNGDRYFFALLESCFRKKIIPIPLNSDISNRKFRSIIQQTGARYFVSEALNDERMYENYFHPLSFSRINPMSRSERNDPIIKDTLLTLFTSGTTGKPKGICISKENIDFISRNLATLLDISSEDKILNVVPISFDYGLYQYFMAQVSKSKLILNIGHHFPSNLLDSCLAESPTIVPLMPSILALFRNSQIRNKVYSNQVKITSTGEKLTKKDLGTISKYFPNSKLYSMYGLTECKRVSCLLPTELKKWPSVGRPIPGTSVQAVGKNGDILSSGVKGRLKVIGPHVSLGYLNDYDTNDCVFFKCKTEQAMLTNDIISLDDDGYVYYHGRMDDIIKISGKRSSTFEINQLLEAHKSVSIAITKQIEDGGKNKVVSIVVLNSGHKISEDELKSFVYQLSKEPHLIPNEIIIQDSLAISDNLKII